MRSSERESGHADRSTRMALHGALHLWPNGGLFVGADMVNEPHRHFTCSIIVGLDGPIPVRASPMRDWTPLDGVLVAPNVEQQLDARGRRVATFQVDPESHDYARIAHHFGADRDPGRERSRVLSEQTLAKVRGALRGMTDDARSALDVWSLTIDELATRGEPRRDLDLRIRKVLELIKGDFLTPPPAGKLAAAVGLSPGRLIHLFTREMGLPIRRYILWLRLRDVLISVVGGASLTEAAHHAGFSDSAHLSRTFRGMFGFPPSTIAEGRGRVRLSFDADTTLSERSPHPAVDPERLARARAVARLTPL
ncbi:MAG TPA: AraC family transcriptional regulator [Polyangiaceae bacterium]